jgi:hypothetical protein
MYGRIKKWWWGDIKSPSAKGQWARSKLLALSAVVVAETLIAGALMLSVAVRTYSDDGWTYGVFGLIAGLVFCCLAFVFGAASLLYARRELRREIFEVSDAGTAGGS